MSPGALHAVTPARGAPSALCDAGQPAVAASPVAATRATTILLAEADPEIARTIAGHLLADGFEPMLARSSEHARALAEMRPPRLAILGELESARAALELLEQVRSTEPASLPKMRAPLRSDLPVIVLCSTAQELDLLRAFEAGADDFLARPPRYLHCGLASVPCSAGPARWTRPRCTCRLEAGDRPRRARRAPERSPACVAAHGVRSCWCSLQAPRIASFSSRICCAASGATGRRAPRARSTATPAGCGASSRRWTSVTG